MYIAHSIDDVFTAWNENPNARICAGGTDILVRLKDSIDPPELIDISRLTDVHGIAEKEGVVRIGAMTTYTDIECTASLPVSAKGLLDAVRIVGSPQIRNRGTIGGNIMNASPAGDSIPPLIALGASVVCYTEKGREEFLLENFFISPGRTKVGNHALLSHVILPHNDGWFSCFVRLGQRNALAISKVSLACAVRCENGCISDIRIALGAVAPKVIRAHHVEKALIGCELCSELPESAGIAIQNDAVPISDIRSTEEYRKAMCTSLLTRAWHILRVRNNSAGGDDE